MVVVNKIIHIIMTGLLFLAGSICPDFISALLQELKVDNRTKEIVFLHYIQHEKFESIPDLLKRRCELRQVFKVHKDFIDKLYTLVITYKRRA